MNTDEHRFAQQPSVFIHAHVWLIPLAVILVALIGLGIGRAVNFDPHMREMLFAAGVCLIAGETAIIPLSLARGSSQASVAQAGLIASMLHLFASAVLGGGLIMTKAFGLGPALVYWLLAQYWFTLIALVIVVIKSIQAAPSAPAATATSQTTTG